MGSLFANDKKAAGILYGWNVELQCQACGFHGLPRYEGKLQSPESSGDRPTIYAKLACPACGNRLLEEAGRKLAELFRDVALPEANKRIVREFIIGLFLVPLAFAILLVAGVQQGWWGYSAFAILLLSAVFLQPLIQLTNRRIAMLRSRCECGKPVYVFMGLVDRTYCYRCSSCGRLLRLRD